MQKIIIFLLLINCCYGLFNSGDVFAGVGNGKIKRFSPTGTLLQTLTSPTINTYETGMTFDSQGNLYATKFDINVVSKFDNTGILVAQNFAQCDPNSHCESILINAKGEFYVGQADGTKQIVHFDSTGNKIAGFSAITSRGTDWIDLAADQCTMFYTSEDNKIRRKDVCTNTQLSDFATTPTSPSFALRIRQNGEVLVASRSKVHRFDNVGTLIQSYTIPGCTNCNLFALNLDPDQTTFWTGDISTGVIYHLDIATGSLITQFSSSPFTALAGLAIYGEITAAAKHIELTPIFANKSLNTEVTIQIQVVNFDDAGDNFITLQIMGANGPKIVTLITDENGTASYTYTGTSLGDDTAIANSQADNTIVSNIGNIHWYQNEVILQCTYTYMRCTDINSYQTCDIDSDGNTFWSETKDCCSGFGCQQNGNFISCDPEICTLGHMRCINDGFYQICKQDSDGLTFWANGGFCCSGLECLQDGDFISCSTEVINICKYGDIRCSSEGTYETCNVNQNGSTYWGNTQTCEEGLTCQTFGNTSECLFPINDTNTDSCTFRYMRCVSDNTYQTCNIDQNGNTFWDQVQTCNEGYTCHTSGNYIYCYPPAINDSCTAEGFMKCVSTTSYQTCANDSNGNPVWGPIQNCQAGLTCHPSENYIYCY